MAIKLLRMRDVQDRVPYSKSRIYQWIAEGKFPRQQKVGGRVSVWRESEIDAWIEQSLSDTKAA